MRTRHDDWRKILDFVAGAVGGDRELVVLLGLQHHGSVSPWRLGKLAIPPKHAWRLKELALELIEELKRGLPELERVAVENEDRVARWKQRFRDRGIVRGDKPSLSPLERAERRQKKREVWRRLDQGDAAAVLAREYGVLARTIERWGRQGEPASHRRKRLFEEGKIGEGG